MTNDNTLGVLLVGCYIAVTLYGLTSHQMYRYFRMYPGDIHTLKLTVASMWSLDTLHTIFIIHACYYYLVTGYFSLTYLDKTVWSLRMSIPLTGTITLIAHAFFSRRIYIFSRNTLAAGAIMSFSLVRMGFTVGITVLSFIFTSFARFDKEVWLLCLTIGLSIISDLIITASLCWFLQKSKTGFSKTDTIIDKLLLYAINTGLLCIIFDSAVLICARTMRWNMIYIGLYFVISKLYSNSLLAVLNSRSGMMTDNQHGSFELQDLPASPENLGTGRHVLQLRRRQPHLTNLEFSIDQGERVSVGKAKKNTILMVIGTKLEQLRSQAADDESESNTLDRGDKGFGLGREISKTESEPIGKDSSST
ncbi:hypothetical protein SCHPADRAFT_929486 [Schizopora paradoxa]|uniref:DUF6534 domain-containing protein n=1 Tax=Schizopora paradoxa TaxID=27342 RepID=A0A0H2RKA4_9AGAM|nr:hypothetical protein SCHPADRAFT_929486 [Schizopora paradoxa]